MKEKPTRGGLRIGAGRKSKPDKGIKASVYLTPENDAYRKTIGRKWNSLVNELIEKYKAETE